MIIAEGFFRDIARLIVWYPFRLAIPRLPLKAFFLSCKAMALMHFSINKKGRSNVLRNLGLTFRTHGMKMNLRTCALKYYQTHYIDRLWIFFLPKLNRENLSIFHRIDGIRHVDDALKNGRGCILVHGHFGPTQMPLFELGLRGYHVTQIGYHAAELSYVGREIALKIRKRYEGMMPANIVSAKQFLRPIVLTLQKNQVVMTAGDGTGGGRFIGRCIPLDFLGTTVRFPTGPMALVRKTGAPILPIFTVKEGENKYTTIIESPLLLKWSGNSDQDLTVNTQLFANRLESYVRQYPDLWHFWEEFKELDCGHKYADAESYCTRT